VARHRCAILATLCALGAVAQLPAPAALAAAGPHVAGFRQASPHRPNAHRGRCVAAAIRRRGQHHASRSSFRWSAHSRRARCPHRHGASRLHARLHHHGGRPGIRHGTAAASSSACADGDLTPSAQNLDRVRAATLCLVNRERAGQGEAPLSPDAAIARAAQAHTEDMASGDYFDHVGPGGDTPLSRLRGSGYIYSSRIGYELGENIGWGTLWLATPRAMVAAWMASPGHRANILDARYRDTAIGVSPHPIASLANGQAGAIYTQDFGVRITG
jgi:uncharacterized protein YkwD